MLTQRWMHNQIRSATVVTGAAVLPKRSVTSDPRPTWRGFFVGYSFYFSFFGNRQMLTHVGATRLPE